MNNFYRVEDLTKVWHNIVSDTNQHQKKGSHQPFEKYLSRVNVAEMSGTKGTFTTSLHI